MSEKIDVLGVLFDNLNMNEAVESAYLIQREHCGSYIVTPNPEIVMACRNNSEAAKAVNGASLIIPDGIGIIYGAKILGTPLKEKIPGIDFTYKLLKKMDAEGGRVFLLGGKPGVAELAENNLKAQFPGVKFVGTNDGYFEEDRPIIEKINSVSPDLLLVCLGAPKQELWMYTHRTELNVGLMIGAGGSLDVFSGMVDRAPENWRRAGFEWLYRLLKEPKRIIRMMNIPKFMLLIMIMRTK